ncbi:MAG TPA: bifunctional DNA-formamidopyrimidine glycosylase/DNA-(apurinic or apyrimidinic site) lyase [Candidatus Acidoferrales bacterium]|jgi:formamidopyrimidine-DNA glycosylase
MPELPEVETVARGLQAVLPGRRILDVRMGKTDFIDDPAELEKYLPGSRIAGVRRYGKFILIDLEDAGGAASPVSLYIHLGMTGRVVTCPAGEKIAPHTHVFFALDDGREMRYTDPRRFGRMRILREANRQSVLGPLGLDPMEARAREFAAQISSRAARIKALLLDQRVFRGIGNIYTDESLWRARIHPARVGAHLKKTELANLYRAMQSILREAIRLGGSSISDYVNAEGQAGEFQIRHRVYQREGKKCSRCGHAIRRIIVAGRSSYFCPHCQRAPRHRAPAARKPRRRHRQRQGHRQR